jgi:Adaptin C-terminal domain
MRLKMNPQSSRTLAAFVRDGVTQTSEVTGAGAERGTRTIKIRWRLSFKVNGEGIEESGGNDSIVVT